MHECSFLVRVLREPDIDDWAEFLPTMAFVIEPFAWIHDWRGMQTRGGCLCRGFAPGSQDQELGYTY